MDEIRLISLDLETSGLIPGTHVPLSIGAVDLLSGEDFYVEFDWPELIVTPDALRINKFDLSKDGSHPNRVRPSQAIGLFHTWLRPKKETHKLWAMGMNVGSFDLPMLEPVYMTIPETRYTWPFEYRSMGLNSTMMYLSRPEGFWSFRKLMFRYAEAWLEEFKPEIYKLPQHHALRDAWMNVSVLAECEKLPVETLNHGTENIARFVAKALPKTLEVDRLSLASTIRKEFTVELAHESPATVVRQTLEASKRSESGKRTTVRQSGNSDSVK